MLIGGLNRSDEDCIVRSWMQEDGNHTLASRDTSGGDEDVRNTPCWTSALPDAI